MTKQLLFDFEEYPDDRGLVASVMASKKIPTKSIAKTLDISEERLFEDYKTELELCGQNIEIKIISQLAKKALSGDIKCMFYYLNNICGYKNIKEPEIHINIQENVDKLLKLKEDISKNERSGI